LVKDAGVVVRPDSVAVKIDDERLIANAGVMLTSTLIDRRGLERLVDQTDALLGHRVLAPSTLGTFLRSLSFGHVRQLDRVLAESMSKLRSRAGHGHHG
jgi:hypothetical protein